MNSRHASGASATLTPSTTRPSTPTLMASRHRPRRGEVHDAEDRRDLERGRGHPERPRPAERQHDEDRDEQVHVPHPELDRDREERDQRQRDEHVAARRATTGRRAAATVQATLNASAETNEVNGASTWASGGGYQ